MDAGLLGPAGRWGCLVPPGGSRFPLRRTSGPGSSSMNVFDRQMKKKQKNWAASLEDGHQYDYLRNEVTGPLRPLGTTAQDDVTDMSAVELA